MLLACSSAGGSGVGPDRAEEENLIGFRYCEDLQADLASDGGSGASWWTGRGRTGRLIDCRNPFFSEIILENEI